MTVKRYPTFDERDEAFRIYRETGNVAAATRYLVQRGYDYRTARQAVEREINEVYDAAYGYAGAA